MPQKFLPNIFERFVDLGGRLDHELRPVNPQVLSNVFEGQDRPGISRISWKEADGPHVGYEAIGGSVPRPHAPRGPPVVHPFEPDRAECQCQASVEILDIGSDGEGPVNLLRAYSASLRNNREYLVNEGGKMERLALRRFAPAVQEQFDHSYRPHHAEAKTVRKIASRREFCLDSVLPEDATVDGSRRYSKGNFDMASIIEVVVKAQLSHEESDKKSQRLAAAWAAKRRRLNAGEKFVMTRRAPAWLEVVGTPPVFIPIPARAEIVRRIFEDTVAGLASRGRSR